MIKILIVEDDPLMSRMYQKIFTFEGFEAHMAGDGQEGLEQAKSVKPHLFFRRHDAEDEWVGSSRKIKK